MQCYNCEQRWRPLDAEDCQRIWDAALVIYTILREQGVPLATLGSNPLFMIDGVAACCKNPNIVWGEENDDKYDKGGTSWVGYKQKR